MLSTLYSCDAACLQHWALHGMARLCQRLGLCMLTQQRGYCITAGKRRCSLSTIRMKLEEEEAFFSGRRLYIKKIFFFASKEFQIINVICVSINCGLATYTTKKVIVEVWVNCKLVQTTRCNESQKF